MSEFTQMARALAEYGFLELDAPKIGECLLDLERRGFPLASEHGLDLIQQHILDDEVNTLQDDVEVQLTSHSVSHLSLIRSFLMGV